MKLCKGPFWQLLPILFLLLNDILLSEALLKSTRVQEIPFGLSENDRVKRDIGTISQLARGSEIHAMSNFKQPRGFIHLFHIPYLLCFYAAKGKYPFIPPFLQLRVDAAARTFFSNKDSIIIQLCQKWIQIKTCFRPLFGTTDTVVDDSVPRATACTCARLTATEAPPSVVYFDKDYIGNVSSEQILNTIEFLEGFLPPPTKKPKRKLNKVRGRVDEMDID